MTDALFTTRFAALDDLLAGLDVDDLGDLETLLMFLLDRPIGLAHVVEDDVASLEVIVHGNEFAVGSLVDFPVSAVEVARSGAATADDLGPYAREGFIADEPQYVLAMSDADLITALQQALGKVRVFNIVNEDE